MKKKPSHCKFDKKYRRMEYVPVDVRMGTTCKGNFETLCATLSNILMEREIQKKKMRKRNKSKKRS